MAEKEKQILARYLPGEAIDLVIDRIRDKNIHLKITQNRRSKLGDYRPPIHHPNHRISINNDLNPYAFLITFLHEYAHLLVFEKHRNKVLPHGKEWKFTYKTLISEVLDAGIFPEDLSQVLRKSIRNSKASRISDLDLSRALRRYDNNNVHQLHVEDLPGDTIFVTANGKRFKKGEKQRVRYKCLSLENNRFYLFHPLTQVFLPEQ